MTNISSLAALSSSPFTPQASSTSGTSGSGSSNGVTTQTSLANQDVFLQLLVAQLKNQDPEQPADGTAFVTQLAQFTTLQENTQATTDLNQILAYFNSMTTPPATPPAAAAMAASVNNPSGTAGQTNGAIQPKSGI